MAVSKPKPVAGLERVAGWLTRNPGYWSRPYFLEVASTVDQVAIMTYDTAIPIPFPYGRLVAWTAEWAVDHGVKGILIGVPTTTTT